MTSAAPLPSRARVVIIGGGVIGASVAYHLAERGCTDVLLLEQGQLSCGTTWHAAGLVGLLRATESGTRLVQYSTDLYARLEEETGLSAGYRRCGGLIVARTPERLTQLRRTAAAADAFGLQAEMLSPGQARRAVPGHRDQRPGRGDLAARRRQGQPGRPDLRAGQGGPQPGRHDPGADPGHRDPDRGPAGRPGGDRGPHRRGRRRGRDRGQLRRAVGQAGRGLGRGDRPAAFLRALLRGHRPDRRDRPGPAGAPRPGRLHLLQGRGGRPGRGRVRAGRQALGAAGRHPLPVRVPVAGRGLGALRAADGAGPAAHPGAARDGHQEVLQRPGELHPRQPVHRG